MGSDQCFSRLETFEIKALISQKLGKKADTYLDQLGRFLTSRITKSEFDKICVKTIGRGYKSLHNRLMRLILRNASVSQSPPPIYLKKSGNSKTQSPYENAAFPPLYRKCRSRKLRDRFSPLGPLGKPQSINSMNGESKSKLERPQVEDGEEVEKPTKSPGVQSQSPLSAPLGVQSPRPLTAPLDVQSPRPLTSPLDVQSPRPLTSPLDVQSPRPLTAPIDVQSARPLTAPIDVQSPRPLAAPLGVSFDHKSNATNSIFGNIKTSQCSDYIPDTSVQSPSPLTAPHDVSFNLKSNSTKFVFGNIKTSQCSNYLPDTSVQSASPITAPFGVSFNHKSKARNSVLDSPVCRNGNTCLRSSYLPDTATLRTRLEKKLEREGMKLSMDSANLLNNGLNAYIRRLIEPCFANPNVSMSDFRTAMELNPQVLGEEWPIQLEKICFRDSEE